jgi:gliding motility-associated-like protein
MTICPSAPGFGVFATMDLMTIATGDQLTIYNGNSTAAPQFPDMPLDNTTTYNTGAQFQATVANASGCLTFEFVSNGDGTQGNFAFSLDCEARCQTVISSFSFSDPSIVIENSELYVNICLGDTLFINGDATFPENNTEYAQSTATSEFLWNWGDNSPPQIGQNLFHVFTQPGGYLTNLVVTDINGCRNFQDQILKVRVAPIPEFVQLTDTILCLGEQDTLSGLPQGTIINGQVVQGDTVYFVPPFFSGDSLFLPDGNGAGYNTSAFLTSFGNGDVVQNCGGILELEINLEHSYLGDLEITLICPNGQSVILKDFASGGGGTYLGNPWDNGIVQIGSGLSYNFTSSATTTLVAGPTQAATNTAGLTVVPGDYLPEQPFTNLIGCPLNGQWTLNITDNLTIDDGYLFNWSLNIAPCMYPDVDSFTMVYDFGYWDVDPTIIGIVSDSNTIIIEPDTTGLFTYTYYTENQFGCEYEHDYTVFVDGFEVQALPEDTSICNDTLQLTGVLVDVPLQCEATYLVSTIPVNQIPLSPGTAVTLGDDALTGNINIPFPFEFFCQNKTNFVISSNGFISFNAGGGNGCCSGQTLPDLNTPNDLIALFWSDLNPGVGGQIRHGVTGTAPNRVYVVQFTNVPHHLSPASTISGQIQLFESTNFVEVHCVNCMSDGGIITSGIENSTGNVAYASPGHNANAAAAVNQAWRFAPGNSLGNYVINWSPNTNISATNILTPNVWPSTSTDYILSVTNTNNCTFRDTSSISVGGNFAHGISPDDTICAGDNIQLTATGGAVTFAWTPNDGSISDTTIANPIFSPTVTTTYTVALDSFSCVTYESVTITVIDFSVDSTIIETESCAGASDASIEIVTTGLVNPQFSIDGGTTFVATNLFPNLAAGTYDIVVSENGLCDTTYQVFIIGGAPLIIDSISLTNPLCGGINDGEIQVYISTGIAPYTFSIDNGLTEQLSGLFTNLAGGTYTVLVTDSFDCTVDSIVTLSQPLPLDINAIQIDSVSCFGGIDGAIEVLGSDGTAPYLYSTDGISFAANANFAGLSAGTYTIYVQDFNLCIDSADFDVEEPAILALSASQVDVTCTGFSNGSATVTVLGGTPVYSYLWDDLLGQTNATANNLVAGTYQVIVTDNNACEDSISVTILEPTDSLILVLDSVGNVLCNNGATGNIQVITNGGTPNYSYSWSNGSFTEDLNNVVDGTYTVTVTDDNGCQDVLTATITEPTALNLVLTGSSVDCFGNNSGAINATTTGGTAPYLFSWVGPNGFTAATEDIATLLAGTYTLTVTDDNGCTISQSSIITQPADVFIGFTVSNVSCFDGNDGSITANVISGGTAPFSFQWDANANNQATATASGLIAGSYSVVVTDDNGCSYTSNTSVSQPLDSISLSMQTQDITCAGSNNGIATVTANGGTPGYTYLWNDPSAQTNAQATNLAAGSYQVTVTDNNACIQIANAIINEPAPITNVPVTDTTNCFGDATGAISIQAGGGTSLGYAYSIDGGETFQNSPDFFNLAAGVYEVVVQDLGSPVDCYSETVLATVFEQPFFSFEVAPSDTTLQLEESVTLELLVNSPFYDESSIAQVTWYPTTGLNCFDCVDPTVLTYDSYTEYTATVYYEGDDAVLCNAMVTTIIIVENNLQLFIPNAFTPGSFDNVNNVFEVFGEGIEYMTMQVYNRWGEKIFESSNQRVSWDGTYQGLLQNPGVYTYYIGVEYLDGKKIDKKGSVTLIR